MRGHQARMRVAPTAKSRSGQLKVICFCLYKFILIIELTSLEAIYILLCVLIQLMPNL